MGWEEKQARYDKMQSNLKRVKGNPNKLKSHCILHEWFFHSFYFGVVRHWRNDAVGYFRTVNTRNEMSQTSLHCVEYGESIVRGRRRGQNLPNSYSDRAVSAMRSWSSWKTNSKRKRQYKPK